MKNLILDPQPHRDYAIYSCIKLKAIEDCIRSGKRSTFHYRIEHVIDDPNSHSDYSTVLKPGKLGDLASFNVVSPLYTRWEANTFGIRNFHKNNLPKLYEFARKRGTPSIVLRCWFFVCRKIR